MSGLEIHFNTIRGSLKERALVVAYNQIKELEQKLSEANEMLSEFGIDELIKRLAMTETEVISRGENFNRVKDKLDIANQTLKTLEGTDLTDIQLEMIRDCLGKLNGLESSRY